MLNQKSIRISEVLVGSLVSLAFLSLFSFFLFSRILSQLQIEKGLLLAKAAIPGVTGLALFTVFVSFFSGAYLGTKLSGDRSRFFAWIRGLGIWAVTAVFLTTVLFVLAIPVFKTAITGGMTGLGSISGLDTAIAEIQEYGPQIETEMHLAQGRLVSRFTAEKPRKFQKETHVEKLIQATENQIHQIQENKALKARLQNAVKSTRILLSQMMLAFFGFLLLGVIFSVLGSLAATLERKARNSTVIQRDPKRAVIREVFPRRQ